MKRSNENGKVRFIAEDDFSHSPGFNDLRDYFTKEMQEVNAGEVILDLTSSNTIDSQGIGLLVGLFRECTNKDIIFKVDVESPEILRVLKLCRLDKIFEIREVSQNG